MFCSGASEAKKRYQKDVWRWMALYGVLLLSSAWFVKHDGSERWFRYFWSVLPAIPVVGVLARMGRYLREETDEYQRWLVMQSILVGTGVLLGAVVVNDFLRSFAGSAGLPPFAEFILFCAGMGVTQQVQRMRNRGGDE